MAPPKVSVVIPVFNGERFVKEAIDSVFAQTFRDFEVIVVDDGSSDGTREIVAGFGSGVVYRYQPNAGADVAYNAGIRMASGSYVAFLDHDDVWYPHKLESQVRILDDHASVGMTYCEVDVMDQHGRPIKRKTWAERRGVRHDLVGDFRAILKRKFPSAVPSAMLIRREVLERIKGFNTDLPRGGGHADVQLCILAGEVAQLYFTVRSLARYRVHEWQMSHRRREDIHTKRIALLDSLWNRWREYPENRALLFFHYGRYWSKLGRQALAKGDLQAAERYLTVSLHYRPFAVRSWLWLFRFWLRKLFSSGRVPRAGG